MWKKIIFINGFLSKTFPDFNGRIEFPHLGENFSSIFRFTNEYEESESKFIWSSKKIINFEWFYLEIHWVNFTQISWNGNYQKLSFWGYNRQSYVWRSRTQSWIIYWELSDLMQALMRKVTEINSCREVTKITNIIPSNLISWRRSIIELEFILNALSFWGLDTKANIIP